MTEAKLDELVRAFGSRQGVLFLGAGVSMQAPANLPGARAHIGYVVETLATGLATSYPEIELEPRQRLGRLKAELTMETMLEQLEEVILGALPSLLSCYGGGEPNGNHRAAIALLQSGAVRAIVTTNFDTLLERALPHDGPRLRIFRPVLTPFGPRDGQTLLKIHGSMSDAGSHPDSLVATVRRVGKGLSQPRRQRLLELLRGPVLFAGYSASDLDLRPLLVRAARDDHFWVERKHDPSHPILARGIGRWIAGDLDEPASDPLIGLTEALTGQTFGIDRPAGSDWAGVDSWLGSLVAWQRALALAVLFTYVKAGPETRACLAMAKTAGAPDAELVALLEADSLADEGSYEVALSAYRAIRSNGAQRRSWTRRGEAYCLRHLSREQESLAAYEDACRLARLGGSEETVSIVRRDIVSLLVSQAMRSNDNRQRDLATRALGELRDLIPAIRATGDLRSLANAIRHRGRAYTALGRARAGEIDGRWALELFTNLGDERGKCIASRSVAESVLAQGRTEAAEALLTEALDQAQRRLDEPERLKVLALLEASRAS